MTILHIEHATKDFDTWKAAFDRDPAERARSGVRRYVISRPVDQPLYVLIDLEFDDRKRASAFLEAMEAIWQTPRATAVLGGAIQTRLLEQVEVKDL